MGTIQTRVGNKNWSTACSQRSSVFSLGRIESNNAAMTSLLNTAASGVFDTTGNVLNLGAGAVKGTLGIGVGAVKGTVGIGTAAVTGAVGLGVGIGVGALTTGVKTVRGVHRNTTGRVLGRQRRRERKLARNNSRKAWESRVSAPYLKLELVIECHRLPKKDSFSEADAFAYLWEVPASYIGKKNVTRLPLNNKQEREIGQTEVVRACRNPRFAKTFRLEYKFQESQAYVIRVYDEDLRYATDLKEHDYIGGCVFTLSELMGASGCAIARPLSGRSGYHHGNGLRPSHEIDSNTIAKGPMVVLYGQEILETREVLEFRFSAQGLGLLQKKTKKNIIKGLGQEALDKIQKVGNLVDLVDKFNPFFRFEKLANDETQEWKTVWKSEVVKDDQNPTWSMGRLPLQVLCDDDPTKPLRISIWAYNKYTQDDFVGNVETSVAELVQKAMRGTPVFEVYREQKNIFGTPKQKRVGRIKVLKGSIINIPSMLQYIAGGCHLDLMIAVDCTRSANGDLDDDKGLHYRTKNWLNDYQAAMHKIGTIFDSYQHKHDYALWGFGASYQGKSPPFFSMQKSYNDSAPLATADDLIAAYDYTVSAGNPDFQLGTFSAIDSSSNVSCHHSQ
jgi:C2 domain